MCYRAYALNRGSQGNPNDDSASPTKLSMLLALHLVIFSSISVGTGLRFAGTYAVATRSPWLPECPPRINFRMKVVATAAAERRPSEGSRGSRSTCSSSSAETTLLGCRKHGRSGTRH